MHLAAVIYVLAVLAPGIITADEPECPCRADVVFVIDRSGSVKSRDLHHVKDFLTRLLERIEDDELDDCFRTAAVSFLRRKSVLEYGFDYVSVRGAIDAINNITNRGGDGYTDKALHDVLWLFQLDYNPTRNGCRNVVLITDGSSERKDATLKAAWRLRRATRARMLIVRMLDPSATPKQKFNRNKEITGILGHSREGSKEVFEFDFHSGPVSDSHIDSMLDSLCEDCNSECVCGIVGTNLMSCYGEVVPLANKPSFVPHKVVAFENGIQIGVLVTPDEDFLGNKVNENEYGVHMMFIEAPWLGIIDTHGNWTNHPIAILHFGREFFLTFHTDFKVEQELRNGIDILGVRVVVETTPEVEEESADCLRVFFPGDESIHWCQPEALQGPFSSNNEASVPKNVQATFLIQSDGLTGLCASGANT